MEIGGIGGWSVLEWPTIMETAIWNVSIWNVSALFHGVGSRIGVGGNSTERRLHTTVRADSRIQVRWNQIIRHRSRTQNWN
jgi:hypothetical protein